MGQNLYMQTASWLVSREMTAAAGPWNTELLGDDDGEYFCRVLLNSEEVPFVPEARVYYRASGSGSLSYVGLSDRKRQAHWRSMLLHIGYLRSLEDTPRTKAACIRYLRCSLMYFYPERPDIVAEAQQLAHELGGELGEPRFSWKYSWINRLFGPTLAKRAQLVLPRVRGSAVRSLDKALFRIGRRRHPQAHDLAQ